MTDQDFKEIFGDIIDELNAETDKKLKTLAAENDKLLKSIGDKLGYSVEELKAMAKQDTDQ